MSKNRPIVYREFTPHALKRQGTDVSEVFDLFSDYTIFQEEKGSLKKIKRNSFERDILLIPNENTEVINNIINSR